MKIALKWLQQYFEAPLPRVDEIADAYTFHSFEIDEATDTMLDVKVLPNRSADCLSHRGLAKELSAILNIPLAADPLRADLPQLTSTTELTVTIEDSKKCSRYMGALVQGVKVAPSPAWLREALESVGQRSINNIVDATNYVMLNIGQPLHAFDAAKLTKKDGSHSIMVRAARSGEKITTLSGEEFELSPGIQLITDAHTGVPIAIAGVKGGKVAEVTADTTDIIVESASFDGTTTRRAAQALKLFTDASQRFQNRPSPDLAAYGMRDVLALILEIAGGHVVGTIDAYPVRSSSAPVAVSLSRINEILGSGFTREEVRDAFSRLALPFTEENDMFTVTPPFERTDLVISENLVEEVGRIIGYDKLSPTELPATSSKPDQARFCGIERMKDQLVAEGYIEVSTQSFAAKGDITLANPLDQKKPALRTSLEENLDDALVKARHYAPLVLLPGVKPKLFEVGTVFSQTKEHLELRMTERVKAWGDAALTSDDLSAAKLEEYGKDYVPKRYELGAYKPFSSYPFIARDIALWVPVGTDVAVVETVIRRNAGDLLVRFDQFDTFEKEGRVSYAFRLVFQSMERTLTDEEAHTIMTAIASALTQTGYEVR